MGKPRRKIKVVRKFILNSYKLTFNSFIFGRLHLAKFRSFFVADPPTRPVGTKNIHHEAARLHTLLHSLCAAYIEVALRLEYTFVVVRRRRRRLAACGSF